MKPPKQPVMSQDKKDLLNLRRLPARLTVEEAALVLGCRSYDIPVLEQAGLLKPLARSEKNHARPYAAVDVEALARDPKSLSKAEQLWRKRWHNRNHNGATQQVAGNGSGLRAGRPQRQRIVDEHRASVLGRRGETGKGKKLVRFGCRRRVRLLIRVLRRSGEESLNRVSADGDVPRDDTLFINQVGDGCGEHGVFARDLPLLLQDHRKRQPVLFDLGAILFWLTLADHHHFHDGRRFSLS